MRVRVVPILPKGRNFLRIGARMRSPLFPPEIAEAIARTKESLDEYRLVMAIARLSSGEELTPAYFRTPCERQAEESAACAVSWESGQSSS
jgi:hypothetical protein